MTRYLLILLLTAATALSETIYVANVFQGSNNGTTTNNAHGTLWLNTPGNQANPKVAGKVGPGDTVRFVGIITNSVSVLVDGDPGSPITFKPDDVNAKFSAPSLVPNTHWITVEGREYITIEGLTMELPQNGTGLSFSNAMVAIYGAGTGSSHITITNNHIGPLFRRASISNAPPACIATYFIGSDIAYLSNYVEQVHGAFVHSYTPTPTARVTFYGNTITNFNHGIEVGAGQSVNPVMDGLTIKRNVIDGGDAYESPDGVELGLHRDPIFLFNQSGLGGFNGGIYTGYITNVEVSYNFIRMGATPQSTTAGTAAMFLESFNNTSYRHVRVFNNISVLVQPLKWSGGGGFIAGRGTDVLQACNTAVGWGSGSTYSQQGQVSLVGTNAFSYDNLCISGQAVSLGAFFPTAFTNNAATAVAVFQSTWSDYNIYNKQDGNNSYVFSIFVENTGAAQSGLYNTLPDWQNAWSGALAAHFDPHSSTVAVALNSSYAPTSAANIGTNLYSLGITDDFYGSPRSPTGLFTVGAVNVGSSPSITNSPIVITGKVILKRALELRVIH